MRGGVGVGVGLRNLMFGWKAGNMCSARREPKLLPSQRGRLSGQLQRVIALTSLLSVWSIDRGFVPKFFLRPR